MSAIGDYIHLTYYGYQHGIEPVISNFQKSLNNKNRVVKEYLSETTGKKAEIESLKTTAQNLLDLINPNIKDNKGDDYKILQKAIEQELRNIELRTLDAQQIKATKVGNYNFQNTAKSYTAQDIENFISGEIRKLNDVKKDYRYADARKELNDILNNIKKKVANLQGNSQSESFREEINKAINDLYDKLKELKSLQQIGAVERIKHIIWQLEKVNGLGTTAKEWSGALGESVTAIAAKKAEDIGYKAITTNLGQQESFKAIDRSQILISDVDLKSRQGWKVGPDNMIYFSYKETQEKIDVNIEFLDGSSLGVSTKAYSYNTLQRHGIENKASSAITLLNNENQENFINHYLNMNSIKDIPPNQEKNVNLITELVKKIILIKLMTGWNTATNKGIMKDANVFFVIDTTNYKVYVKEMTDVINTMIGRGAHLAIQLPSTSEFISHNRRDPIDPNNRISKLIMLLDTPVSVTTIPKDIGMD